MDAALMTLLMLVLGLPMLAVIVTERYEPKGAGVDWDRAVRRYEEIKVAMTVEPDSRDRWIGTVTVTGSPVRGGQSKPKIGSWTLRRRRDQEAARAQARELVDQIRSNVAAAQSRKMRMHTEVVPL